MKTLLITLIMFTSLGCFAQTNYEKSMGQALDMWKSGKAKEAAVEFEKIAAAEKGNWIPKYYQALTLISSSFYIQDETEKANALAKINTLFPSDSKDLNAEWLILKGLAGTSDLISDPMTKAMTLTPEIVGYYEAALQLEPNNPRAIVSLAEFNINSKRFTGGDTKAECESLTKALPLFVAEKNKTPFYPSWGKERAETLLKDCK